MRKREVKEVYKIETEKLRDILAKIYKKYYKKLDKLKDNPFLPSKIVLKELSKILNIKENEARLLLLKAEEEGDISLIWEKYKGKLQPCYEFYLQRKKSLKATEAHASLILHPDKLKCERLIVINEKGEVIYELINAPLKFERIKSKKLQRLAIKEHLESEGILIDINKIYIYKNKKELKEELGRKSIEIE